MTLTSKEQAFIHVYNKLAEQPDACDTTLAVRLGITRQTVMVRRAALLKKGVHLKPFRGRGAKPGARRVGPCEGDPRPDRKDITKFSPGSLDNQIHRWGGVRRFIECQLEYWSQDLRDAKSEEFKAIAQKHVEHLGYLFQVISEQIGILKEERKRRVTEALSV